MNGSQVMKALAGPWGLVLRRDLAHQAVQAVQAAQAAQAIEADRGRAALLAAVSHDLLHHGVSLHPLSVFVGY